MAKKLQKSTKRPPRYRVKPWRAKVIRLVSEGRSVTNAAEVCGVTSQAVYKALREDPGFKEQYDQAMIESLDRLEDEVRQRAQHGVDEPVVYQGQLAFQLLDETGKAWPTLVIEQFKKAKDGSPILPKGWKIVPLTIRRPADGLATLLLKSRRPDVFRDTVKHTSDGSFKDEPLILVHTAPPEGDNGA